MPSFSYIARTGEGTLEKGSINAINAESAREKLRKQHLIVEELRAASSADTGSIGFSGSMPWTTTEDDLAAVPPPSPSQILEPLTGYIPLIDTFRIFAGWLLAWYGLVYALGSFQLGGKLPMEIPFLQSLFESALVLRFAFGTFLFLLLSTLHGWLKKGVGITAGLAALWILLMVLFHLNA